MIRYIQEHPLERATLLRYLQYAARYAPPEGTDELARFTRRKFAGDTEFQLNLIKSIHAGFQQRGMHANQALKNWGVALAQTLLSASLGDSLSWSYAPLPGGGDKRNPWVLQKRASADGDKTSVFFCSLPRGERLTGAYRSGSFEIPSRLSFYLAGHVGKPGKPSNSKNFIRLRDSKTVKVLIQTTPPRNDAAVRVDWHLNAFKGSQAYLEIVDGDSNRSYAWLAVGRFSFARLNPNAAFQRRRAGAQLVALLKLGRLKRRIETLLADPASDLSIRPSLAQALLALQPDSRIEALAPLIANPSVHADLRRQIVKVVLKREAKLTEKILTDAMRSAAHPLQLRLAQALASDEPGTKTLLQLVASGVASPRLLLRPSVRQKLTALQLDGVAERVKTLTVGLPSEDVALNALIADRRIKYPHAKSSIELGATVFGKHCAACHKVAGKGELIGPQLDGIGNRGLDRVLEDVIDPNRNVDVAFRMTSLVLKKGKIVTGLLRREAGATLVLADNKGKEFIVAKQAIDKRIKSNVSPMPTNIAEIISETDFHHLMAFLLAQTGERETNAKRTGKDKR